MNHVERFRAVMNFQPVDRLPRWEWAMWWDETIARWKREGLRRRTRRQSSTLPNTSGWTPTSSSGSRPPTRRSRPCSTTWRGSSPTWTITSRSGRGCFPTTRAAIESMRPWAARQARGEAVVWITLEGFFWFPRTLMGFTKISLAFYDQPELIHRINQDLTEFNLRILDQVAKVCRSHLRHDRRGHVVQPRPDDLGAAFRRVHCPVLPADRAAAARDGGRRSWWTPTATSRGWCPGCCAKGSRACCPWSGRQAWTVWPCAGSSPTLRMVGHFNKMVMNQGEAAMRAEFERLLPLMPERRVHSQRGPPNPARGVAGSVSDVSTFAG